MAEVMHCVLRMCWKGRQQLLSLISTLKSRCSVEKITLRNIILQSTAQCSYLCRINKRMERKRRSGSLLFRPVWVKRRGKRDQKQLQNCQKVRNNNSFGHDDYFQFNHCDMFFLCVCVCLCVTFVRTSFYNSRISLAPCLETADCEF